MYTRKPTQGENVTRQERPSVTLGDNLRVIVVMAEHSGSNVKNNILHHHDSPILSTSSNLQIYAGDAVFYPQYTMFSVRTSKLKFELNALSNFYRVV